MKIEIHHVGGEVSSFGDGAQIRVTDHGVEVTEQSGEETVRVLFPWSRIEKVTQRGTELSSIYQY
jgi:hypothetical protein